MSEWEVDCAERWEREVDVVAVEVDRYNPGGTTGDLKAPGFGGARTTAGSFADSSDHNPGRRKKRGGCRTG